MDWGRWRWGDFPERVQQLTPIPCQGKVPLRVLIVDAAPATMHALNLKLERERLQQALEPLVKERKVELLLLEAPTPEALRDKLLSQEIHVLHFMGHDHFNFDLALATLDLAETLSLQGRWADAAESPGGVAAGPASLESERRPPPVLGDPA